MPNTGFHLVGATSSGGWEWGYSEILGGWVLRPLYAVPSIQCLAVLACPKYGMDVRQKAEMRGWKVN